MYRDKKAQYIVSLIVLAILLVALFVDLGNSKIVAACLLIPLTVAVRLVIRKRSSHSVHKREALLPTVSEKPDTDDPLLDKTDCEHLPKVSAWFH